MKYSEAKKQIKALSRKYDIDMEYGNFNVIYSGKTHGIYVSGSYEYGIRAGTDDIFSEMPSRKSLYMIMAELASTPLDERVGEKKYQVKVFGKYLNVPVNGLLPFLFYGNNTETVKTYFTLKEIEQLKQRDDIPLDWNKVHFEDAE